VSGADERSLDGNDASTGFDPREAPGVHPGQGGFVRLASGDRLGPWLIAGLIGRGGMGEVYLAERVAAAGFEGVPERVAVKVLSPHVAVHDEGRRRFANEQALLSRVSHQNVVRTIGDLCFDQARGVAWFAMELVPGKSLSDLLREQGALPVRLAAGVGLEVARALVTAHRQGIVHRDVKPSNILVTREGQARLGDFGLARALDSSSLTRTGQTLGTPLYMAPEQAEESSSVGPPADLYALGAVLYAATAGRPPLVADSPIGILRLHLDTVPAPLTTHVAAAPPALIDLVARLLQKRPEDRPTGDDTVAALQAVLAALPADKGDERIRAVAEAIDAETRSVAAMRATPRDRVAPDAVAGPEAKPRGADPSPGRSWMRTAAAILALVLVVVVAAYAARWSGRGGSARLAGTEASSPSGEPLATTRAITVELLEGETTRGAFLGHGPDGAVRVRGANGEERSYGLDQIRRYRFED
jgi:serine/threonine-protein kinase